MELVTTEEFASLQASKASWWGTPWLNRKLVAGCVMLSLIVLLGLIGPLFWNTKLARIGSGPLRLPPMWFKGGLMAHPLGTEGSGRDMLALIIVGAPTTLTIGVIVATISVSVGTLLGFVSGYIGGWVDYAIRILSDSTLTIPSFAVLVVIGSFLHSIGVITMAVIVSLFGWAGPTRVIRSQVLSLREHGYVQMARLSGMPDRDIMFKEMLPNLLPYLAASFTGSAGSGILAAVGLEALGLGPQTVPTLGMTLSDALQSGAITEGLWWWWAGPTAVLVFVFISLFLVTIGLDEIANPRLRGARA